MRLRQLLAILPTTLLGLVLGQTARAELLLRSVLPEKLYYRPGETVRVAVQISNPEKVPHAGQLKVELVHYLDTAVRWSRHD